MAKLTLINGKLRVIWGSSESGSIVEGDWLSPSNEYKGCCCCECKIVAAATYYGRLSSNGLTLDGDSYPNCSSGSDLPEVISGTITLSPSSEHGCAVYLRFWRNVYSTCNADQSTEIGEESVLLECLEGDIDVNDEQLSAGDSKSWSTIALDPSFGSIPNSTAGEKIIVQALSTTAKFKVTATLNWYTQRDHDLYGIIGCHTPDTPSTSG